MIVVEFPQPAPLLSANDRQHWRARARWTAIWRKAAWAAARNGHKPVGPSIVTVYLPVKDRRRRDPMNYYPTLKVCVDACVDALFWKDDAPEYVSTTEPVLVVGAKTVRIEVTPR